MKKTQSKYCQLYKEYYNLQNMYGINWINVLLGNLTSYKYLRNTYTYQQINNEIIKNQKFLEL